jgi:hypothetical protein
MRSSRTIAVVGVALTILGAGIACSASDGSNAMQYVPTHYEDGSEIESFDEYIDWREIVQP